MSAITADQVAEAIADAIPENTPWDELTEASAKLVAGIFSAAHFEDHAARLSAYAVFSNLVLEQIKQDFCRGLATGGAQPS